MTVEAVCADLDGYDEHAGNEAKDRFNARWQQIAGEASG